MIPAKRLLLLLGLLLAAGIVVAALPNYAVAWPWAAGALVLLALVDAGLALRVRRPRLERHLPGALSLATWSEIQLEFANDNDSTALELTVFDHHPDAVESAGLPQTLRIEPGRFARIAYDICPQRRGLMHFGQCELRMRSPFGLWQRRGFVGDPADIRTYPNYSAISKLLAYEVSSNVEAAGLRISRRRGEGIEFHQLRDYRDGDSIRSIDWKATARVSRLIARDYQDERDQQVVFLLDAGRRMLTQDGELSHFDQALNGMLLMSYVALRQGDAVGVMTMSQQRRWLPPTKGVGTINALLNHVYDVQPRPIDVDYVGAATDIALRQRRRALIVLLTNAREEDSHDLRVATGLLQRRHLVIVASLREQVLDDSLSKTVASFEDALRYTATNRYLRLRREAQDLLRAQGVYVEDCLSQDLPSAITNRYLAIKRAGAL